MICLFLHAFKIDARLFFVTEFEFKMSCRLCQTKPKLYSQCLCLLYRLAASHPSSRPMLEHLNPKASPLVPLGLRCVLAAGLPSQERAHSLAAALYQRSWLLRLEALMLLRMNSEEAAAKVRRLVSLHHKISCVAAEGLIQ
jgi:hypothetical protein